MGQKINPISLRLQNANRYFDHCWYSDFFYFDLFTQNLKIQRYLNSILKQLRYPSGRFFIQSSQKKIQIFLFFCSPLISRKIQSFYFRTKYYRIKKKEILIKKKYISKLLNKDQILPKDHGITYLPFGVDKRDKTQYYLKQDRFLFCSTKQNNSSTTFSTPNTKWDLQNINKINSSKLSSEHLTQSINLNPKRTLYFKYIVYLNYLQNFYAGSCFQLQNTTKQFLNAKADNIIRLKPDTCLTRNAIEKQKILPIQGQLVRKKIKLLLYTFLSALYTVKLKATKRNSIMLKRDISLLFRKGFGRFNSYSLKDDLNKTVKMPVQSFPETFSFFFSFLNSNIFPNFSYEFIQSEKFKKKVCKNYLPYYMNKLSFQKHFENVLTQNLETSTKIYSIKSNDHFRSAIFLADEIVYYLERRKPFRRIISKLLNEVKSISSVQGLRIVCSGRVGGRTKKAQRAKVETVKYGRTSLHVFSSQIDFASKSALTSFGLTGVKVWICYKH